MTSGQNPSPLPTDGAPLGDDDIALLCDLGASFPADANADQQRRLAGLIDRGFVEAASAEKAPEKYRLTAKAQQLLAARGVGLNEA